MALGWGSEGFGFKSDRNLRAISYPGLPQKIQQIFPARLKSVHEMINFMGLKVSITFASP